VLLIATERELEMRVHHRLDPLLEGFGCEVHRVPTGGNVFELVQTTRFDLIVIAYPLAAIGLTELLRSIRWSQSACRSCSVMVLAPVYELEHVQPFLDRGVNRSIPLDAEAAVLRRAVADLLGQSLRVSIRVPTRIEAHLETGGERRMMQTENLSETGMRLRGRGDLPVGVELRFELSLPGDPAPVSGLAEVVRQPVAEREASEVRFLELDGDGATRLEALINQRAIDEARERARR
jgi:CheY-like chemotaxis protein